jgi:hypothetical protein
MGGITTPTQLDGYLFKKLGRVAARSTDNGGPPMHEVELMYPVAPQVWTKVYRSLRRLQGKGWIEVDPFARQSQSQFLVRLTELGAIEYREATE